MTPTRDGQTYFPTAAPITAQFRVASGAQFCRVTGGGDCVTNVAGARGGQHGNHEACAMEVIAATGVQHSTVFDVEAGMFPEVHASEITAL